MAGAHIDFELDSIDAERRFLRTYLAAAWDRFEASDFFETGWFWRYGQFNEYFGQDGGRVFLVFDGNPEDLIETEEDCWRNFDGLDSWELHRYESSDALRGGGWELDEEYGSVLEEQKARKGEEGGDWQYRLLPLAAQFSLAYLSEFGDTLPAVAEQSEANHTGVGFWSLHHYTMIQCGYDWYDETDSCLKGIKYRLKTLANDFDPETAREEYTRLKAELEAYEEEFEEWLAENPNGDAEDL
ncbi:hypothetical protein [Halovivax limisalsi]|uniref:hypothetical protein n=1 Tax=Halovivax limisalsi TaxID=1453760 RepID=UPI001FFC6CCB|nr:hypothetical protein [Halovivax limisalsi]